MTQLFSQILIHWIVIYPVDSASQRLNNQGQVIKLMNSEVVFLINDWLVSCQVRVMSWSCTWLSVVNVIITIISFSFRCLILRTFCNTVSNYSHANKGYFCCCCFCIWATRFVSVLNSSSNLASGVASSSHPSPHFAKTYESVFSGHPQCKNLWSFSLFSNYYFPWLYFLDCSLASFHHM